MSEVQLVRGALRPSVRNPVAENGGRRAPATVHYPESDGKPMAESPIHWQAMVDATQPLKAFFSSRPDALVGGNQLMYYEEGNPRRSVSPDVYVAFGVPALRPRNTWLVWVEGKMPDFVLEVTSATTRRQDEGRKRTLYESRGVREYWQFDPTGDYLNPILKGNRLGADGRYRAVPLGERDAMLWAPSLLGLELHIAGDRLRFFDPTRRAYLRTYAEQRQAHRDAEAAREAAEAARVAAEAAREAAEAAREAAESARAAEAEARRIAEARLESLEARLREKRRPR